MFTVLGFELRTLKDVIEKSFKPVIKSAVTSFPYPLMGIGIVISADYKLLLHIAVNLLEVLPA